MAGNSPPPLYSTRDFELVRRLPPLSSEPSSSVPSEPAWISRRVRDGEELTAVPGADPWIKRLLDEDGLIYTTLRSLLNHENLVSIAGIQPIPSSSAWPGSDASAPKSFHVFFDSCDGGSLAENMAAVLRPARPVPGTVNPAPRLFMPESLCWHVAKSVARAVTYLHDGKRYFLRPDAPLHGPLPLTLRAVDRDWCPVLHCDIRAENIYFQQPRGRETYGPCKLGNFARAAVTGHVVSEPADENDASRHGWAMAERVGGDQTVGSLERLLPTAAEDRRKVHALTDEFRALGAVLMEMATGVQASGSPDRPQVAWEEEPAMARCSLPLQDVVLMLLRGGVADGQDGRELPRAAGVLKKVEGAYRKWRSGTREGREYVDLDDEMERAWRLAGAAQQQRESAMGKQKSG